MSVTQECAEDEMRQAFEKRSLERVIGEWMNSYFPHANYLLAEFLFGGTAVKKAFEETDQKQNVPQLKILSAGSELNLGFIRGIGTLFESLKGGVAWNEGEKPPEFFNLYGRTSGGGFNLLNYNVPIIELPSEVFLMACDTIYQSKERTLNAVTQNGNALRFASEKLRADREVVLAAVANKGSALVFALEEFREDKEVVLAAVIQDGSVLWFASEALQNDREVVLAAVIQYGFALECASEALQNDREVVLAAVRQDGLALECASEALQNDIEVVLAAVTQNGTALRLASKALRNNPEVVLAAVTL